MEKCGNKKKAFGESKEKREKNVIDHKCQNKTRQKNKHRHERAFVQGTKHLVDVKITQTEVVRTMKGIL